MQKSKVLTFESWATESEWFRYAKSHTNEIPYLLCDRSTCQDPFFDLFAPSARERQPMITGLCRSFKNFHIGDRYIYVTRLCSEAQRDRGLDLQGGPRYLGVASLIVIGVEASHEQAARRFAPRQYVAAPLLSHYPPGLAHDPEAVAAVSRESCIVHAEIETPNSKRREVALTPLESTEKQWRGLYLAYYQRQLEKKLRAALCNIELVHGREALAIRLEDAPIMTSADWERKTQNVAGLLVQSTTGEQIAARIAEHGRKVS